MQPTYLHVRGVNSLHDLTADLSAVPPGLCAVVGGNGAGKTTLLECMLPAPVWLTMPTRPGTLYDSCTARDSLIELRHRHNGHDFRHVVTVDIGASDKSRPKTEAYLYVDGTPASDGKLGSYREAVAQHLPPQHLVLAGNFATQDGGGGFASLDVHGRRRLFRSMLGLDAYQQLADRATQHRRPLDAAAARLDGDATRLAADRSTATTLQAEVKQAQADLDEARTNLANLQAQAQADQDALAAAKAAHAQLEQARAQALAQQEAHRAAQHNAAQQGAQAQAALDAMQATLAGADDLQARAAVWRDTRAQYEASTQAWQVWQAEPLRTPQAERDMQAAQAAQAAAVAAHGAAQALDMGALQKAAQDAVQAADRQAATAAAALAADDHLIACRMEAQKAQAAQQQAATRAHQLTAQADQLQGVPCGGATLWATTDQPVDCSGCHALAGAMQAQADLPAAQQQQQDAQALLAQCQADLAAAQAAADTAMQAHVQAKAAAAACTGAAQALTDAQALQLQADGYDLVQLAHAAQEAVHALHDAQQCDAVRQAVLAQIETAGAAARDALGPDPTADLERLAQAQAQAPVQQQRLADAMAREAEAMQARTQVVVPPAADGVSPDLQRAADSSRAGVQVLQRVVEGLVQALGTAQGRLQALGDLEVRQAALDQQRAAVARRRAGWVLLERALGPEGIQALEIDAAGPGVSAIANELLVAAGAPYTVQLRTIRPASAGRKRAEVFDVLVHDGGQARDLARVSGGEATQIEEALALAVAVHVAKAHQGGLRTLWRDEADQGLSLANQRRFPAMLRTAMDLGGFDRCYYITHSPVAAVQADSVLLIEGGQAQVLDPDTYATRAGV